MVPQRCGRLVPWIPDAIAAWHNGVMVPWCHVAMVSRHHCVTDHGTMVPGVIWGSCWVPWYDGTMVP